MKLDKNKLDFVRLEALSLEVGDTLRTTCPFCNDTSEQSFTITRNSEGLLYLCFRISCQAKGLLGSRDFVKVKEPKKPKKDRTYKGELYPLEPVHYLWLYNKYRITSQEANLNGFKIGKDGKYLFMPILDKHGFEHGYNTKRLSDNGPKNIIYSNESYFVHYPYNINIYNRRNPIVVVEDILSSIRGSRFLPTVSILGSSLCGSHIKELMKETDHLILMLDKDTWELKTPKPPKYKREFGLCFRKFDLIQVDRDPKDSTDRELEELLKLWL